MFFVFFGVGIIDHLLFPEGNVHLLSSLRSVKICTSTWTVFFVWMKVGAAHFASLFLYQTPVFLSNVYQLDSPVDTQMAVLLQVAFLEHINGPLTSVLIFFH